ncbi:MAG: GNAT family N-acetyltransferase [Myxococcales bacterium]|nr:GNAT family N-acetyltransferase [Myxococcales bacterium]
MLRPVGDADYDAIHAIWMEPSANRYLSFEPMAPDDFRPVFEAIRREASLYVWDVDGEVVATASASRWARRASHVATIGCVATRRDRRRQGHAAAMMRALVARLVGEGVERVDVWVEADNPGAIAFYGALGFVTEGLLRRCFRRAGEPDAVDEVVMAVYR